MAIQSASDEIVDQLINVAPRDACRRSSDGSRRYMSIYHQAVASGVITIQGPANDATALKALFDIAVKNGFGSWVMDYVEEVCADPFFSSANPIESYLLDGECVLDWASGRVAATWRQLRHVLDSPGQAANFDLQEAICITNSLELVLAAMHRPMAGRTFDPNSKQAKQRSSVEDDMRKVQLLQQCLQLLEWTLAQGVDSKHPAGRHSSLGQWAATLQQRTAALDAPTFLDTCLKQLELDKRTRDGRPVYPFASYKEALIELFCKALPGQLADKVPLYLHYLLDAGHISSSAGSSIASLQRALALPPQQVAQWQCQYLLDVAEPHVAQDQHLLQACELLAKHAGPGTPFRFVQVLAHHGRHDVALAVFRASACDSEAALEPGQAATLLDVRFHCGLLAEALAGISAYCSGLSGTQALAQCKTLMESLAEWAAAHSSEQQPWLAQLLALPLSPLQEEALLAWLQQQQAEGSSRAVALPLYFAQRGRLQEALWHYARWQESRPPAAEQQLSERQQQEEQLLALLMERCAKQLPVGLQSASVQRAHGPPALLVGGLPVTRDSEVPPVVLPYRGKELPPFVSSRWAAGDSAELLPQQPLADAAVEASEASDMFVTPMANFPQATVPSPMLTGTAGRALLFSQGPGQGGVGAVAGTPAYFTPMQGVEGAAGGAGGGALGLFGFPRMGALDAPTPAAAGQVQSRSSKRLRATPLVRPR